MVVLDGSTVFGELHDDMTHFKGWATPIKLLCTNRQLQANGPFGTYLESVNIENRPALAAKLIEVVRQLFEKREGGFSYSYGDCDLEAFFIKMDDVVIDIPDEGKAGETIFDLYRYNVHDEVKEAVRASLEAENRRVRIVEGKGGENGFLVESYNRNLAPIAKLADRLNCTIRGAMKRLERGEAIAPSP